MGFLLGYAIFFIWMFLPMYRIYKSPLTSGFKKLLWAIGTFLPVTVALSVTKIVQNLAPTHPLASEIFNSTISAFLLVITMLVGGFVVLALHDGIYKKQT